MRLRPALWMPLFALLAAEAMAAPPAPAADNVRVYRCVGSTGAVSLQDAPCSTGRQEVREMQRPRDPAPRVVRSDRAAAATPATGTPAAPVREVRYVHVQPPQPMYECTTEEGERYVSDSNAGNPRWVPVWTSVYLPPGQGGHHGGGGGGGHRPPPRPLPPIAPMSGGTVTAGGGGLTVSGGGGRVGGSISLGGGSRQWQGEYQGDAYGGYRGDTLIPTGNVLVRDTCTALPVQEVCSRLKDRRWELGRRYNSALQGERDALNREQRGIDARLDQDCGGH